VEKTDLKNSTCSHGAYLFEMVFCFVKYKDEVKWVKKLTSHALVKNIAN
jgi:hypothetical protein